jgi:NADPH2:quinone reductase
MDKGALRSRITSRIDGINAADVRRAHSQVESGSSIGKTVLARFLRRKCRWVLAG